MRRLVLVLTLAAALGGVLLAAIVPTSGQITLPTPKGQLGGPMPLEETPLGPGLPFPTPPTPPPTATATPPAAGTPPATPIATPAAG